MNDRIVARLGITALLTLPMLGIPAPPAAAAAIPVTQTDDVESGPGCTLRQAIRAANANTSVLFCFHPGTTGADLITLPAGTYSLSQSGSDDTAENGDLDITEDLVIEGAGADRTVIDAAGMTNERAFHVLSGVTGTISGVTITGGTDTGFSGGGILNLGTLTLDRVWVRGNTSSANGGGISNTGTLIVRRSTVSGNQALAGGGINHTAGTANIRTSTVSGNQVVGSGGGILSGAGGVVTDATITDNTADSDGNGSGEGGGLVETGTMGLRGSVLADNIDASPAGEAPDCSGDPTSLGHNVVGSTDGCTFTPLSTDAADVPAGLVPSLADNGGPTPTHRLLPSSPAVDRIPGGNPACSGLDQRGVPRPEGAGCDSGAYELARCLGRLVNLVGTRGPDILTGTPGSDGVLGLGGQDLIRTRGGTDGVCAGGGGDTVRTGSERDRARGDTGHDLLAGGGERDVLRGNGGNDRIRGGGGRDRLFGNAGGDSLAGGPGRDRCRQGPGSGPTSSCEA